MLLLSADTGHAAVEGPWCAVVMIDDDAVSETCHFQTFEACRATILSGNRGMCNNNPRWRGQQAPQKQRQRQRG
jgi:hypothetical protein